MFMWILIQTQLLSEVLQRQLGFIITEKKTGMLFCHTERNKMPADLNA